MYFYLKLCIFIEGINDMSFLKILQQFYCSHGFGSYSKI